MYFNKLDELVSKVTVQATPEEVDKIRQWLFTFYKESNFDGDIPEKVDWVIEEATKGWPRASKSFLSRVKQKVGGKAIRRWERMRSELNRANQLKQDGYSQEDIVAELAKERELREGKNNLDIQFDLDEDIENTVVYGDTLFDYLSREEKKFWKKRDKEYREEFDFNNSSDAILLEEVIYNEILLRRLRVAKITGEGLDNTKGLHEKDLIENIRTSSEKLGILRDQRIKLNQNIEGNVSEIALMLDEKLKKISDLKDKALLKRTIKVIKLEYEALTLRELEETAEELALLKEVEKMGEINPVPKVVAASMEESLTGQNNVPDEYLEDVVNG